MLPQQALLNTKSSVLAQDVSAATLSEVPAEQQGQSFSDLMTQQSSPVQSNSIKAEGEKTELNTELSVQQSEQTGDNLSVSLTQDSILVLPQQGNMTEQDIGLTDPDLSAQTVQLEEKDGQELPLDIQVQQIIDQQVNDEKPEEQTTLLPPDGNSLPSENSLVYAQPALNESKGSMPQGDFQKNTIIQGKKPQGILNYADSQKVAKQETFILQNRAEQGFEQFVQQPQNNPSSFAMAALTTGVANALGRKDTQINGKLAVPLSSSAANSINLQDVSVLEESEGVLKTPLDSKHIEKAVGQRIHLMIQQGKQVAEIRIDPPQLGKIDISVQNSHQQLSVHMVADNPQVRDMLAQSIDRLQQQLAQDQVTQVQVSVSSQGQQNAQSQQQAEKIFDNGFSSSNNPEQDEEQIIADSKPVWVSNSLVDVYS